MDTHTQVNEWMWKLRF